MQNTPENIKIKAIIKESKNGYSATSTPAKTKIIPKIIMSPFLEIPSCLWLNL